MFKSECHHRFNFGRVFFPEKTKPIPSRVYFQPLGNHVGNVRRLVKAWNIQDFPGKTLEERKASFQRVLEAANIHDNGKPQKFNIDVKTTQSDKFKEYIYSFKGHRFLAKHQDSWVKSLAVGHHDFSVHDISRDAYKLRKESQYYADILAKDQLAYARELYILEMCDQIEAELACRVIGDDGQAESRTFMDYTTTQSKSDEKIYLIDPFPFSIDSILINFKYWSMELNQSDRDSLQKCLNTEEDYKLGKTLDEIAKNWWNSQKGKPEESYSKSITLRGNHSINNSIPWDCDSIYKALGGENFIPNPMQKEMFEAVANNDYPAVMLKSPTGSGKMEAILFPALAKRYRLFLPLPARSLLEDQKERIEKYLKKFSKLQVDREISLVVDTGAQMYRRIYLNGEDITSNLNKNSRRHLYKGDVILTTLDKFLYRYFGFGDKQKSFIFPLRIHDEKTLICFDEAHTYDEISFTNFQSLVRFLYEAGRSVVLMTATMPPEHYERFNYFDIIDFVDNTHRSEELFRFQQQTLKRPNLNKKSFEWYSNISRNQESPETFQNEFANIILMKWRQKNNCRIIAVVETVKDAAAIYQILIQDLGSSTDHLGRFIFLYHGRIADQIRPSIYKQIQERDAESQAYILVTTSAIEVGCDLNADVLISQICPPENLVQRAGRCNRKGNIPDATVILVGNEIPDFANSLNDVGWQKYQETLQSLKALKDFNTQALAKCITRTQQVDDYRVVELFSMLHDYVYEADLICQPTHEKGLVITRSWQPSATLIYKYSNRDDHTITVPIDRLIQKTDNQYSNTYVYERYYNHENTRWESRDLGWGYAYLKDIVIEISPDHQKDEIRSDSKSEYTYNPELGFVNIPGIFIKLRTFGFEEKLLYQYKEHKSIITYIKSLNALK